MKKLLALLLFASPAFAAGDLSGRNAGVFNESTCTAVDLSTDASTTIYTGRAALMGVYVSVVMSAHAVVLEDGAATKITIPASTAAGSSINTFGMRFETSIIVNPNDSSTGTISICYLPL